MSSLTITIAADSAYLVGLAACVRSVIEHTASRVVVIDCGLSDSDRAVVKATVPTDRIVDFWRPDLGRLSGLSRNVNRAVLARLIIGNHGFDADRLLYVDADTLLLRDIEQLATLDLRGRVIAAVPDAYTPVLSAHDGLPNWRTLALDPNAPFFNAGVLLIDVAAWRDMEVEERARAYMRVNYDKAVNDQHALNAACCGDWLALPHDWNVTRYWFKRGRRIAPYEDIIERARILHYCGPNKPWRHKTDLPSCVLQPFFASLDATPLSGWRPGTGARRLPADCKAGRVRI